MLPDFRFVIGAVLATAFLGVTCVGLFATVRLTHQAKLGREAPRALAFADRADWNQFLDPASVRHFESLTRMAEAMAATAQPAPDQSIDATPPSITPPPAELPGHDAQSETATSPATAPVAVEDQTAQPGVPIDLTPAVAASVPVPEIPSETPSLTLPTEPAAVATSAPPPDQPSATPTLTLPAPASAATATFNTPLPDQLSPAAPPPFPAPPPAAAATADAAGAPPPDEPRETGALGPAPAAKTGAPIPDQAPNSTTTVETAPASPPEHEPAGAPARIAVAPAADAVTIEDTPVLPAPSPPKAKKAKQAAPQARKPAPAAQPRAARAPARTVRSAQPRTLPQQQQLYDAGWYDAPWRGQQSGAQGQPAVRRLPNDPYGQPYGQQLYTR